MRCVPTTFQRSVLLFFLFTAASLCPWTTLADQITFGESYSERLTPDGEVIWSGTSTLEVTLPWNGVTIDELDGDSEIDISLGDFQFNRILDGAEESFEPGVRSARFTETDFDHDGNEVNVVFVDVSWNTKTFTISAIFRNYSTASQENFFGVPSHRDIPGSFQEDEVFYISFGNLSASYPVTLSGRTTIARRVVDEIEYDLNSIQLSGSAELPPNDTIPPTVSITSPSANGRLLNPLITGKASDNRGIAEVFYRIGTDEFFLANGTTNWSAEVALEPGTNVLEVKSIDFAGNESPVLTRTFFYVVTSPLIVDINNPAWGSTTLTNGQLLELGRAYSITANPAPGFKFAQWLGDFNSLSQTLNFVMTSNLFLQVDFAPNPFIPIQGIYNGLFSDPNGVTPVSAGFFTATVKESGAFSGKILLGGARHSFSGQFAINGHAEPIIARRGKPPLNLSLQLSFDGGLSGSIVQGDLSSSLEAELARSTTNSAKTKYTLLIPPASDSAMAPGGYGYGCAFVDLKSKLRFRGKLGDGTFASQATTVSQSGRWPLFISHGRGRGVLLGWLTFADEPESDIRGENVTWAKLSTARAKFYPNGFTNAGTVIGSLYVPPPNGTPALNPDSGSLEFSGGNLSVPLTNTFSLNSNNLLVVASTNRTTLHLTRSTGLLRGRFFHPDLEKPVLMNGILLQKPMWGGGFFRATNQTGAWSLLPDPVQP